MKEDVNGIQIMSFLRNNKQRGNKKGQTCFSNFWG
jgi:hypothetical protein